VLFAALWLTTKPQRAQRRLSANQNLQIAGNFPAQSRWPACRQAGRPTIQPFRFLIQKKNFVLFAALWLTTKPQRAQRRLSANQNQQIAGNFPAQGGLEVDF
jgi:hypothetical protein